MIKEKSQGLESPALASTGHGAAHIKASRSLSIES